MKTWRAKLVWSDKKRIPPAIPAEARVTYSAYCPIIVFEGQYDKPIWENRVSTVPLWSAVVFNEEVSGTESVAAVWRNKRLRTAGSSYIIRPIFRKFTPSGKGRKNWTPPICRPRTSSNIRKATEIPKKNI